nr:imidazole glycerol phosphate synthase hisHF, chloroplastic-like [Tanacetum cinerariifolium]
SPAKFSVRTSAVTGDDSVTLFDYGAGNVQSIRNAIRYLGLDIKDLGNVSRRYFWSLESEGDYSVAFIRKLIDEKRFQEVGISTRWVKSVPSKVNITAWNGRSGVDAVVNCGEVRDDDSIVDGDGGRVEAKT